METHELADEYEQVHKQKLGVKLQPEPAIRSPEQEFTWHLNMISKITPRFASTFLVTRELNSIQILLAHGFKVFN